MRFSVPVTVGDVADDAGAAQLLGAGVDVAVLEGDVGAHGLEALEVLTSIGRAPMAQPPGKETRARP